MVLSCRHGGVINLSLQQRSVQSRIPGTIKETLNTLTCMKGRERSRSNRKKKDRKDKGIGGRGG